MGRSNCAHKRARVLAMSPFPLCVSRCRPIAGALLAACLAWTGCDSTAPTGESEDDLTSNTALARTLTFQGAVYVPPSASDATILSAMRAQTQSGFGALREANVGVNSRELKDITISTWKKSTVVVFDTANAAGSGTPMQRVEYTFTDTAVVPKSMSTKSSLPLALLGANYQAQKQRVFDECTTGDKHAQDFMNGSLWYVFNPALGKCKTAITKEQQAVDADRKKVPASTVQGTTNIPKSETTRLYIPVTFKLSGNKTNNGTSWPEYDRLWTGGMQKNKLVIGMVNGMMADWSAGEKHDPIDDDGYRMWMEGLRAVFKARPGFKLSSNGTGADLTSYTVGATKVTGVTWDQVMSWELDYNAKWPTGITTWDQKKALRVAVGNKIIKNWLTFQAPVKVKIGSAAQANVTIELNTYFGAEGDPGPHKKAIKNSDVFVYNGHSYIGYGPLDPRNFTSADFPSSYQILFINSCVSYNYYEKDYWALKPGGTANLEIITNGLESWVAGSGSSMGRFVGALIGGKQPSYTELLKAAEFSASDYGYDWGMDALRVVDGELDNKYKPSTKPIVVQ